MSMKDEGARAAPGGFLLSIYGQGFDQACHPFFSVSQDVTTNNKGSRVKFSHNQ